MGGVRKGIRTRNKERQGRRGRERERKEGTIPRYPD
jgi:hypothetical protein